MGGWLGTDSGSQIADLARSCDFAAVVAMAAGIVDWVGFAMRSSRGLLDPRQRNAVKAVNAYDASYARSNEPKRTVR